eukprot:TRINITY_DN32519_c0_g1_i1.p1 TRINITY_DN32519_c0_g1~~TRINITY_DN32519_c0_g1_i1.p1  ORF type:complete len:255 (+),score=59.43 TRINITY_DN32519_c0_g1_i1:222-986(+)
MADDASLRAREEEDLLAAIQASLGDAQATPSAGPTGLHELAEEDLEAAFAGVMHTLHALNPEEYEAPRTQAHPFFQHIASLQQMGYNKSLSEHALLHTEHRGVEEAVEWILSNPEVAAGLAAEPTEETPGGDNEARDICERIAQMQTCNDIDRLWEQAESVLFFASHGRSDMLSTVDRIRQILLARDVPYVESDLCDHTSGEGLPEVRSRMEAMSSGCTETPQLHIRGKFIGAGRAALEELMFLIDSGQDLNNL